MFVRDEWEGGGGGERGTAYGKQMRDGLVPCPCVIVLHSLSSVVCNDGRVN